MSQDETYLSWRELVARNPKLAEAAVAENVMAPHHVPLCAAGECAVCDLARDFKAAADSGATGETDE